LCAGSHAPERMDATCETWQEESLSRAWVFIIFFIGGKMENKKEVTRGGVGFCGLLTLIFITLKLLNVIDWAWGWVLAPLWIPLALIVLGVLIMVIVAVKSSK